MLATISSFMCCFHSHFFLTSFLLSLPLPPSPSLPPSLPPFLPPPPSTAVNGKEIKGRLVAVDWVVAKHKYEESLQKAQKREKNEDEEEEEEEEEEEVEKESDADEEMGSESELSGDVSVLTQYMYM